MLEELMRRIEANSLENKHQLSEEQKEDITEVLRFFTDRFERMEDALQRIATATAQDYPPAETFKDICAELSEVNVFPQKTSRPTLRNWPEGTEWAS